MTIDLETGLPEKIIYPIAFQFWAPLIIVVVGGFLDALIPLPQIFGMRLILLAVILFVTNMCLSFRLPAVLGTLLGAIILNFGILRPLDLDYMGTFTLEDESGRVIAIYDEAIDREEAERRYRAGDRGRLNDD